MTRYARQVAIPRFGQDGQARMSTASALVIGAGGLASPVLQYLVGAGMGHIRLVDPDNVSLSNLHRQTLFRERDIGKSKVQCATNSMIALNPDTQLEPVMARLEPDSVSDLCQGVDIVIDCADSFAASYIASDYCVASGLPLISASVVGISGYCGGFCGGAPGLRAVFPDLPNRLGSCDTDGILGPSVGIVGALQAQMVFDVLTHAEPSPLGQIVTFDAPGLRFGGFRFDGAENPEPTPSFISDRTIRDTDFLIDLRTEGESGPSLDRAMRKTVDDFITARPVPHSGQRAVLACRSGLRAWQAAHHLSTYWTGEIKLIALGDTQGD